MPKPEAVEVPGPALDTEMVLANLIAANKKKYVSLTVKTFEAWLRNNWSDFLEMPEENRFEIQTKYTELYQRPFPAEIPA